MKEKNRKATLAINSDKRHLWKEDVARSVDCFNDWFIKFAPEAYVSTRIQTTKDVESALELTANLTKVNNGILKKHPDVLPMLRMATAPPIARDRLIGLAGVSTNLVFSMEDKKRIPPRISEATLNEELQSIGKIIMRLADKDIFPWLGEKRDPKEIEVHRAATIVADRLCGAIANPIIRNAQEKRQLASIKKWLEARGYSYIKNGTGLKAKDMKPGTFAFHLNVAVAVTTPEGVERPVNIPIDVAVKPLKSKPDELPLLIEAKSAGDFTNVNKRRKEEATKVNQLKKTYGKDVRFILFLCGYFDTGYLGYEAAEGIDWAWEHRIDDLSKFGV